MLRTFIVATIMLLPTLAFAQATVTPSETQLKYNNEGVLKMQENDYEGAVARFQSSLAVGELNITYLNLGRSFYRLGRCLEAAEAFSSVEGSPAVASPSRSEIKTALTNFERDLSELCTAEIVFVCASPARVGVDSSKPRSCEGELSWPVAPGTHDAIRYDVELSETVTATAGTPVRVELVPPVEEVVAEGGEGTGDKDNLVEKTAPAPREGMATKDIFGWFALGSGAVLLGTALVVDLTLVKDSRERAESAPLDQRATAVTEFEDNQTLNKIVIGSGVGLAVIGTAMLLWPDPETPETVQIGPALGPDGIGATARWRW